MSRIRLSVLLICSISLLACSVGRPATAQELRTWSDGSGEYELKAKFISQAGNIVTLSDTNGVEFKVELSKLSQADQDYVKNLQKKNPFQKVDANPFKSAKPSGGGKMAAKTGNWAGSTPIVLQPEASEWSFQPPAPLAGFEPNSVSLPKKRDFFEGLNKIAVSTQANVAVLGFGLKRPGRNSEPSSRLIVCDLEAGRVRDDVVQPGEMVLMAVHDDGQRVLMRRNEFGFGNHDRLEIWNVSGGSITQDVSWVPYNDARGGNRDVNWAEFLPDERLLTSNGQGKIALWDLGEFSVISHLELGSGCQPALSSDRSTLAFAINDNVGLWDIESQKIIAMQKTPERLNNAKLAFTPDNKLLG